LLSFIIEETTKYDEEKETKSTYC